MKKALKIVGISVVSVICLLLAAVLLFLGGLNVAKFIIYDEYYDIEEDVCKNPGLSDGFVCQGIAASEKNGVILVSGYMKDHSASRIYVTNEKNESYYVSLMKNGEVFDGHAGGIATTGDTVYLANGSKVYSFAIADLLALKNGERLEIGAGHDVNVSAAFVYTDEEYLYVGEFHDGGAYIVEGHESETAEGTHYAYCTKYALSDLTKPLKAYSIRNKVQGICFTPGGKVVMSTSYGLADSVYYVYDEAKATDSGKTVDGAPLYYLDTLEKSVNGPAMSEDLDWYNGKVITLSESASDKYIFGKFFFADKIVVLDFFAD
jgi:hypothetical protein